MQISIQYLIITDALFTREKHSHIRTHDRVDAIITIPSSAE